MTISVAFVLLTPLVVFPAKWNPGLVVSEFSLLLLGLSVKNQWPQQEIVQVLWINTEKQSAYSTSLGFLMIPVGFLYACHSEMRWLGG